MIVLCDVFLPSFFMTTIIERNTGDSGSNAMTMVVAVLAVVVIAGIALYMLNMLPFLPRNNEGINVDVNLPTNEQQ